MRRPRVRFTVRRMMALVAACGLAFGAYEILVDRPARFRSIATYHDLRRARFDAGPPGRKIWYSAVGREVSVRQDEWHRGMVEKYRRAERHPWLPVPPDPPEPK